MGIATGAIAVLPSYEKIGVSAPLLLLVLRLLQGFSVGGEYTGSVSYLVETAPQHRRGLAGSFANFGSTAGMSVRYSNAPEPLRMRRATPAL